MDERWLVEQIKIDWVRVAMEDDGLRQCRIEYITSNGKELTGWKT